MSRIESWKYHEAVRRAETERVATVARDLGVATSTVRTWGTRHRRDPAAPPPRQGGARPHYHGVSPADQAAIKTAKAAGMSLDDLCRKFRRSRTTIYKLVNGVNDQRRRPGG